MFSTIIGSRCIGPRVIRAISVESSERRSYSQLTFKAQTGGILLDQLLGVALITLGILLVSGGIPWTSTAALVTGGLLIPLGLLNMPLSRLCCCGWHASNHPG